MAERRLSSSDDDELHSVVHDSVGKTDLKELILLFETCSSLWNPNHKYYLNTIKKNEDLDNLVQIYKIIKPNATKDDVKKKINSLRSNSKKEFKKIESSKRSGSGANEVYQPTSSTFHLLKFLGNFEKPKLKKSKMAAAICDAPAQPSMSAVEIQQEYFEAVGGVDWELYEKKDRKYLLQKIAVALFGPPTREGNLVLYEQGAHNENLLPEDLKLQGYELRDEESTMKVFQKICEQAKYSFNGDNILVSILRVVCVIPKKDVPFYIPTPSDYWVDLHDKKGDRVNTYIFHVFALRQCIPMTSNVKGCRVYIDHDARVYKDWEAYLSDNTLPKSVMVVPENGIYKGKISRNVCQDGDQIMPKVKLTVVPSPALGLGARVLSATDTISTVANLGALAGIVGALAAPAIAPVALGTAVGVGVVTGTYAIVRSSINLADRKKHEQSIGLEDSDARAAWINIMVSTAGISFSAAGKLLAWAAASGTNVKILMNAVRFLQYANLGTGFIGVANSLGDMIYKYNKYDETPTKLEIFQFTTSALFLGIGVMSNRTAQEIVQDAQADTINKMRDSLTSNAKRKMFDKMTAETRRVNGMVQGNAEVIQSIKNIKNRNEFFAKFARMNKQLNKNKLRISLSPDGNAMINNSHKVGVAELQALGKRGRDQLFSKYGPANVTTRNAPTRVYSSNTSANASVLSQNTSCSIRPEEIIKITTFIINLSKMDQEFVAEIISTISSDVHDAFLLLCAEFIASLIPEEIDILCGLDKHYKVRAVLFILNYLRSKISVDDSDTNGSFANSLKKYVRDGRIDKDTVFRLKKKLIEAVSQREAGIKCIVDPRIFDDIHSFRVSHCSRFMAIRTGEVLRIGCHEILIRSSTVEKLEDWLEVYPQNKCDMLLNLCFGVISCLSCDQMVKLQAINPDEDAVLRVSSFLIFETEDIFDVLIEDYVGTDFFDDIAHNLKADLMRWCSKQRVRSYKICEECGGRRYGHLS